MYSYSLMYHISNTNNGFGLFPPSFNLFPSLIKLSINVNCV